MTHNAEKDVPRVWLLRECPECHSRPHYACRDEDGYLANPHDARVFPPEGSKP